MPLDLLRKVVELVLAIRLDVGRVVELVRAIRSDVGGEVVASEHQGDARPLDLLNNWTLVSRSFSSRDSRPQWDDEHPSCTSSNVKVPLLPIEYLILWLLGSRFPFSDYSHELVIGE